MSEQQINTNQDFEKCKSVKTINYTNFVYKIVLCTVRHYQAIFDGGGLSREPKFHTGMNFWVNRFFG